MSIGQIMAECDCTHEACEARGYCMATRIAELEAEVAALKSPPEEHCAKCGAPAPLWTRGKGDA